MKRLPREWLDYEYLDPQKILVGLKKIAQTYPFTNFDTTPERSEPTNYGNTGKAV